MVDEPPKHTLDGTAVKVVFVTLTVEFTVPLHPLASVTVVV